MAVEIYMPQLSLTMTEGTVTCWLKSAGDLVNKGEAVLNIETDKATVEVEAPADGILGPILAEEGLVVPIGGILGYVLAPGEPLPSTIPSAVAALPTKGPTLIAKADDDVKQMVPAQRSISASPRARRLAHQLGVDLASIEPSGSDGRIVEADVRRHEQESKEVTPHVTPAAQRMAEHLGVDLKAVEGSGLGGRVTKGDVKQAASSHPPEPAPDSIQPMAGEGFEPLKGIRRLVAERMVQSFRSAPHAYLSAEVEATSLMRVREGLRSKVEEAIGTRLTVSDLLIKICAQALTEFPGINVFWSEIGNSGRGGLQRHPDINVGLAVATDNGLVVPVIHRADRLSLTEIAQKRGNLVARARSHKLSLVDLEAGTFTLTNLGMFGVDQFQAIINPPQAAILAVGRIQERPIASQGAVVVRPTTYLTLSIDHRLVDGADGARFLRRVAQLIEEPYLLMS
jgi:pyruvate dehydrogenase E2 component (dihydrolipoamide acetyltransferase)